ncbi:Ldh family oxidoreductase [Paracoccus aurantiacus]|uniref:Ldh family oxidoreductase n=2 Tax=Paracoccus aurantiacus TaxID=2599412 RepID=A0A5C6S6Q8_9RHOB|nr:Ldh family oxidoreductase [Paracoccus aurantiacus]
MLLSAEQAEAFAAGLFAAHGVPAGDARLAASCLVRADLRGVDTHGIVRMPGYLERISRGLVNPAPSLEFDAIGPSMLRLDGQNGLGFVIASRAIAEGILVAEQQGLAMIGVRNSTHFGMAAAYLLQAIEAGYLALVFTNASPALPPWGGTEEVFGTSPFAVAAPNPGGIPFVLDMAPTIVARGKIRKAAREGKAIPPGWALDADGAPTTDPDAALQGGTLLPIGGPKGAGLSIWLDIMCGVLTGANFAGGVGDQYKNFDRPQGVGHLITVIRPDICLGSRDLFGARMQELVETVKNNRKADGVSEIFMPGEIEARTEAARRKTGIPYRVADLALLAGIARLHDVAVPDGL